MFKASCCRFANFFAKIFKQARRSIFQIGGSPILAESAKLTWVQERSPKKITGHALFSVSNALLSIAERVFMFGDPGGKIGNLRIIYFKQAKTKLQDRNTLPKASCKF